MRDFERIRTPINRKEVIQMPSKEDLVETIEEQDEILDGLRDILDDPELTPFEKLKEIEDALAEEEEGDEPEE